MVEQRSAVGTRRAHFREYHPGNEGQCIAHAQRTVTTKMCATKKMRATKSNRKVMSVFRTTRACGSQHVDNDCTLLQNSSR